MKIDVNVLDGQSGDWKIETMTLSEEDAQLHNLRSAMHGDGRYITAGSYKRLTRKGQVIMSNTPAEIRDHLKFFNAVRCNGGHILINGLGLGMALTKILEYDNVETVTVIENSEDVIKLVSHTFSNDKRVTIIYADAFTWQPPKGFRYNIVWHDIWDNICSDNLEEMGKLHRKYGRRTDYQDSWCKSQCKRQRNSGR